MPASPLDAQHRALGARMTPFGGWDMPLQYTGVLDEHKACRSGAAVFDVSHLGTVEVQGPGAFQLLQDTFTNDLAKIGPGRAQYTHLLDDGDAHVVDDIIVCWHREHDFLVMPNASNTDELLEALCATGDASVADVTATRAVLAVQGPDARTRLQNVSPEIAAVPRFCVRDVAWSGHDLVVAGTGYTGEDGVEIQVPLAGAVAMWEALLAAGITPAGLGARDTLRLEAGLPLHGHELGPGITPLQARLGWVVGWDKPRFRGRDALLAERARGPHRRLVAVTTEGRQPPREGYPILADGHVVGEVTSGNYSPILGHGIAMAFVDAAVTDDVALTTEFRGKAVAATRVTLPFVRRETRG